MKNNKLTGKEIVAFHRVFFRFSFPGMALIIFVCMISSMQIPLKHTILCWIGFIITVIAAYTWAKWIVKSPEGRLWMHYRWHKKKNYHIKDK